MAPDPSNEPESDQPPLVTSGPLLLDDGRVVTPRYLGGTYTLCELLRRPDTGEPATTRQGLDHRRSRPVGSLIPLPNKTLANAAPVDADPATGGPVTVTSRGFEEPQTPPATPGPPPIMPISSRSSVVPYKRPPTSLRARWLAEQMRRLRKERGVALKTASRHLGIDHSALARREKAEWPFLDGVASLLDVYQLTDGRRRATLLHLDADTHRRDAWDRDDIPPSNPDQQENAVPFPERHRPTVRNQWLAEQLRQLRVDRRLTLQQVGTQFGVDWSSVGRFERGELKLKYDTVTALLDLYHVFDDRQRDQLCSLALDARHGDHWDVDFGDELDYRPYVNLAWLETRATAIRYYATTRIPDLLQTPEYTARLIQTQMGIHHPTPEHQAAVAAHTTRRNTFHEGKTRLSAVITETALRTQVGDTHLAEQQIAHLHALANQPRYTIRVLPDGHETAARYDTPFTVFDMPDPYPPVAVTHSLAGRLYLEHPRSLRFTVAHDHLHTAAHNLVPDPASPPTQPNETAGRATTAAAPRTTNDARHRTAATRTANDPHHTPTTGPRGNR